MPDEKNPYPKGSYRYKLWERKYGGKKEAEEQPKAPPEKQDTTKRRKHLDDAIEAATESRVKKMRDNQSTDSNN
jgi:hypothetical protein